MPSLEPALARPFKGCFGQSIAPEARADGDGIGSQVLVRRSSFISSERQGSKIANVRLFLRAARQCVSGRQEEIMLGSRLSTMIVMATLVSSTYGTLAAEHQRARHARHHTGFASLDYGRTPRTMFDGTWNLSATTTAGSCGSYGFRVSVINGRVVSPGVGGVSGRVTPAGNVSVTVRQSSGVVSGAGRLSARSGTGRWTARSASGGCVGYWQASRGG